MQGKAFYSLLLLFIWWSCLRPAMLLINTGEINLYISLKRGVTEPLYCFHTLSNFKPWFKLASTIVQVLVATPLYKHRHTVLSLPIENSKERLTLHKVFKHQLHKLASAVGVKLSVYFSAIAARKNARTCQSSFVCGKEHFKKQWLPYFIAFFFSFDSFLTSNASSSWKILVSSTTNVAVDRILLG